MNMKKYIGIPRLIEGREDFSTINDIWKGQTAYIIGGGSSFSPEYANSLRGENVIGCNESYQLGGDIVKYCHFLDLPWWNLHKEGLASYTGISTTCNRLVESLGVLLFKSRPKGIEFSRKDTLGHNRNTGLSAINLAIHLGATRIILFGFDMCSGEDDLTHWYSRSSETNKTTQRMHRRSALEVFEDVEEKGGIEIINASLISKIPYWPKVSPTEVLP